MWKIVARGSYHLVLYREVNNVVRTQTLYALNSGTPTKWSNSNILIFSEWLERNQEYFDSL